MKRMLSFLLTMALLAFASTALAQKQFKCQYCGRRAASFSELKVKKCSKSPSGKCSPIYDSNAKTSKSTKTTRTYNFKIENKDGVTIYYNISGSEASVTYKDTNYNSYSGTVVIPETVTYRGTTYSITSIGDYAFYNSKGLTQVNIPNSVKTIGGSAFNGCSGLKRTLTIPNSVTKIGDFAFAYCTGLTSVTIPKSVTEIESGLFFGCTGLTAVTFPENVTSIGNSAFSGRTGLEEVNFNATARTSAGTSSHLAFKDCTNITTMNFGDNVTIIPDYLCYGFTGLTEVTIPNSVTSIGSNAFSDCVGLKLVNIGNSVKKIGNYAFHGCSELNGITIPKSITELGGSAFYGCKELKFKVEEGNEHYCAKDGALYTKDMKTLIRTSPPPSTTNNATNSSSNTAKTNKATSSNTASSNDTNSRYTYCNGSWTEDNGKERGRLYSVEIRDDGVVVTIEVEATKARRWLYVFATENTYIVVGDVKTLKLTGLMENNEIVKYAPIESGLGWRHVGRGETRRYKLFFSGHFPPGISTIAIKDYGNLEGEHGYSFRNYKINNPRKNYLSFNSESEIKRHIDQNNDGICGIYEPVGGEGATLACVNNNGEYCLIYLSSPSSYTYKGFWQIGDIKASLQRTASSTMKANWFNGDKSTKLAYVTFDGAFIHVAYSSGGTAKYLKMYPTASSSDIISGGWTGSGFALRDGYVVTNNHVVKGASSISVVGVNGSSTEMKARVVAVDSKNDLALIKINDSRFSGFGSIPYAVRNTVAEPGTDVFVLGYPMTQYMGEEIKLTNGIISSKSGYQGDITTYQISAPVQPGNSGGPMFDTNGNLIGIVNAGIPDAENVGYAIKTSYLFALINSQALSSIIPSNNTLMGKSLSDKVRSIRNYVFQIKCH